MTHLLQVIAAVMGYMMLIVGIWAIASLIVLDIELKSRSRLEPSKRQNKLYIHSIADDR